MVGKESITEGRGQTHSHSHNNDPRTAAAHRKPEKVENADTELVTYLLIFFLSCYLKHTIRGLSLLLQSRTKMLTHMNNSATILKADRIRIFTHRGHEISTLVSRSTWGDMKFAHPSKKKIIIIIIIIIIICTIHVQAH